MFISEAYAQGAAAGSGNEMLMSMIPFILIFVIMYFLILRPQQRRIKEQQAMVNALRRGDQVTLAGGLIGKITKVIDDATIEVEIADNVKVKASRAAVTEVRSKGEPANDEKKQG